MKASKLRRLFNVWPPLVFSGIRVKALGDGWRYARVGKQLHVRRKAKETG